MPPATFSLTGARWENASKLKHLFPRSPSSKCNFKRSCHRDLNRIGIALRRHAAHRPICRASLDGPISTAAAGASLRLFSTCGEGTGASGPQLDGSQLICHELSPDRSVCGMATNLKTTSRIYSCGDEPGAVPFRLPMPVPAKASDIIPRLNIQVAYRVFIPCFLMTKVGPGKNWLSVVIVPSYISYTDS